MGQRGRPQGNRRVGLWREELGDEAGEIMEIKATTEEVPTML